MKVAVMGAGAVGCYYGGLLAKAGHEVTLIGRPGHVEAIRRDGLRLQSADNDLHVPLSASTEPGAVNGADIVLFCVKSSDTASTATSMVPFLRGDAVLVSLQNGVGNADLLRAALPHEIIPAAVYVATAMAGDGHVRHHGGGRLVIGKSRSSATVAMIFSAAGVPVDISDNIVGVQWTKLIINCAYNALSAISGLPYAKLVQHSGVWQVLREIVNECLAVAAKAGVVPVGDVWEGIERIPRTMAEQTSSTAQDIKRGRPTEIDWLNGFIVRKGQELGVPTPVNLTLHTLVRTLESR